MYAERVILETDPSGNLKMLPKLPANHRVEAIFLVLDEVKEPVRRRPHPDIAGKMKIVGDILESVPESDWDLPQ